MAHHIERERKYDIAIGDAIPDLRQVPGCARIGAPVTHTLHAEYYDTDDLRLAAQRITLRRRTGGDDAGWHLKLPVAEHTRHEITTSLDAGARQAPAELSDLVAAHVRGRPLVPVAEIDTRRTEYPLLDQDGRTLAVLADDVVHGRRLGRDGEGVTLVDWRELEVEAVEGTDELLAAVDASVREQGLRESAAGSKLSRVLDGRIPPPRPAPAVRTAGDVLLAGLNADLAQLLAYDSAVRMADHDDDSVHKMRVAARRFRSTLRTSRRLLDHPRAPLSGDGPASGQAAGDALEIELKWLADALGEVRDLEVLTARFRGHLAELPGATRVPAWLRAMAADEAEARERLRHTLLSRRYFDLLDTVEAFLAAPALTSRAGRKAAKETPAVVTKAWRTMIRRHAQAEPLPSGPDRDVALHRTRKAAKRARYAAEVAGVALGPPAGEVARRAKRLQSVLGSHQDGVIAVQKLTAIADDPRTAPGELFDLGRLAEVERRESVIVLRRLPKAAEKAAKPRPLRALRNR